VRLVDAEPSRDVDVTNASRVQSEHLLDDVVIEDGLPVQDAVVHKHPTLRGRVAHVVGLRPKKQMIQRATGTNIAVMADAVAFWNRSPHLRPDPAVCQPGTVLVAQNPVATGIPST
jgi:hypothetical protein